VRAHLERGGRDAGDRPTVLVERGEVPDHEGVRLRAGLDQDDARRARVDPPEVAREGVAGDLGERPGHLDPGRPAPDDHEREPMAAGLGVLLALGRLERDQGSPPDLERVLQRLQPRRVSFPLVLPEVRVARPGGEDESVVRQLPVREADDLRGRIDRHHLSQQDPRVALAAEDASDRVGDLRG